MKKNKINHADRNGNFLLEQQFKTWAMVKIDLKVRIIAPVIGNVSTASGVPMNFSGFLFTKGQRAKGPKVSLEPKSRGFHFGSPMYRNKSLKARLCIKKRH